MKHIKLWALSMNWFAKYWGCHQIPDRSFSYRGYQFPLCARCTGILIGEIIGMLTLIFISPYWWTILLIIPMAIDGLTQQYCNRQSNNLLRLITGLFGGYSLVTFIVWSIKCIFGLNC